MRSTTRLVGDDRWTATGRVGHRLLVGLTLIALLAGCNGDSSTPPDRVASPTSAPTMAAATPPATPDAAVSLGDIVWTSRVDPGTGEPLEPVSEFPPTVPTLYAAVPVRDAPAGSVVVAAWSLNGTPIKPATQEVRLDATADGWVVFHLTWTGDGGWPVGTYEVTLTANGRPAGEASVPVTDSDDG